ncbi:MAG: hypothetical protein RLZZ156_2155 [Deinococcota bacterium]
MSFGSMFGKENHAREDMDLRKCEYIDSKIFVYRKLSKDDFETVRPLIRDFFVNEIIDFREIQNYVPKTVPYWWKFDFKNKYLVSKKGWMNHLFERFGFLVDQKPTYVLDISKPREFILYAYVVFH